jgi:diguanylate cyclase
MPASPTKAPPKTGSPPDPQALGQRLRVVAGRLVELTSKGLDKKFATPVLAAVRELRGVWSAMRRFTVIRDVKRAKAMLKEERELRRAVHTLRGTLGDLSRTNDRAAAAVDQQLHELDEIEATGEASGLAARLRGVTGTIRATASDMRQGITRSTAALASSEEIIHSVGHRLEKTRQQALQDGVTGLPNRVAFEERLEELAAQPHAATGSWCVALADIDGFAEILDEHGPRVGDGLLYRVAEVVQRACKAHAGLFVARFGDGQLGILLPRCLLFQAGHLAEEIRRGVAASKWECKIASPATIISPTVTVALVGHHEREDAQALLERVEACLETARERGQDTVLAEE